MKEEKVFNLRTLETPNKQLAHTENAKDFIAKNPGAMNTVFKIVKDFRKSREPFIESPENGIKVTRLNVLGSSPAFKIEIRDHAFFLKTLTRDQEEQGVIAGNNVYNEVVSSANAREILKDLSWVEVVDYQLAYRDKNFNYFVSDWREMPTCEQVYRKSFKDNLDEAEIFRQTISDKIHILYQRLKGYQDINMRNMFYDEKTQKLVLFDLHKSPD